MVALFLWRLIADVGFQSPDDERFYDACLARLCISVNPDCYTASVWSRFFSFAHQVLIDQERIGEMRPRNHPFDSGYRDHDKKCYLSEASDILISAWFADKSLQEGRGEYIELVRKALWGIANCALCRSANVSDRALRAIEQVKVGLFDVPPSTYEPISKHSECSKPKELVAVLSSLSALVGLASVKENVERLIHFENVQQKRRDANLRLATVSRHLVFTGNPGTGKTTVARMLGEAYASIGILKRGHLVEIDRAGLVAGYVGQTALKAREVIESAIGGILFIDEAYALTSRGTDNDFGPEVVEVLLKMMEDFRDDLVVIVAGYPAEMSEFVASNPGLASRFSRTIHFPDYSPEEMVEIFRLNAIAADYELDSEVPRMLFAEFARWKSRDSRTFGNARDVRRLFEFTVEEQAQRLGRSAKSNLSTWELSHVTHTDVDFALAKAETEFHK